MEGDCIPEFESKLPNVGTTIFTVMSALAAKHNAINLSQGFPDYDAPEELKELLIRRVREGQNQYPPMIGTENLRAEISTKIEASYERGLDPTSEVTVVPGATEAIFCAIAAFVKSGDEVILFDPAYDCYAPAIILAGGTPVHIPLLGPEFRYDWDRVSDSICDKTRMIIVNSPHNPTGKVWSGEDVKALEQCTSNTRIPLTDGQFGALVSLVFNIGTGNFERSTLRMTLNRCEFDEAALEFRRWRFARGKVLRGLIRRRAEEEALFRTQ